MPESQSARIRRLVASGHTAEQAAEAEGVPPSRARAALERGGPGRPPQDTEELRVRIDGELWRRARAAGVERTREIVERALRRGLR